MYLTVVSPTGKFIPGKCVVVILSNAQLSVAVGSIHSTGITHALAGRFTLLFVGHPCITGSTLSTIDDEQQTAPPLLLCAARTVNIPDTLPIANPLQALGRV